MSDPGTEAGSRVPLGRAALVAAVSATVFNASVYLLAVALGVFEAMGWFPGPDDEMKLAPVLLATAITAGGGVGVYGLIRDRTARPLRVFTGLALAVLAVSIIPPFFADWPLSQVLVQDLMHVATAAAVLWAVRP